MNDEGWREFPAEQILRQAAAYPPMTHGECQMSTTILAAAYPELRYVKGTRRLIIAAPGAEPIGTEVLHWWNELPDGTVIDSAFQPGPNTSRQLPHVTLRYTEEEMSDTDHQGMEGRVPLLRQMIRKEMKTLVGTERDRRRQVVEEMRDDLPRLRRDYESGTVLEPRILRGSEAVTPSTPNATGSDQEIPPAFRKRR
jgi:hypothetical protein